LIIYYEHSAPSGLDCILIILLFIINSYGVELMIDFFLLIFSSSGALLKS
jgi:hypothetical protein